MLRVESGESVSVAVSSVESPSQGQVRGSPPSVVLRRPAVEDFGLVRHARRPGAHRARQLAPSPSPFRPPSITGLITCPEQHSGWHPATDNGEHSPTTKPPAGRLLPDALEGTTLMNVATTAGVGRTRLHPTSDWSAGIPSVELPSGKGGQSR